jgi:lipooligosaccharide transport system ATP-binding protein
MTKTRLLRRLLSGPGEQRRPGDLPEAASAPAEASAPRNAVTTAGLVKRYGETTAVDGLDLTIERGECFGLLGPNGAGKTTTLRLILGQTPPTEGSVHVLGHPIPAATRAMHRRTGIVPQTDNLDPDFTVAENLLTYGSYFGLSGRAITQRLDDLLAFAGLGARASAAIDSLSGGMRRRLTLARALVNRPELLVLDEPTTGLDPQARQYIWSRLHRLQADGQTLLLTTHYMEEAERLCDRAAIIDGGRLVACDSPKRLIERFIEPHVVELRGELARAWRETQPRLPTRREEDVGETVLLYTGHRDNLLACLEARFGGGHLYRPANLEDVFLRLTGRDLRD